MTATPAADQLDPGDPLDPAPAADDSTPKPPPKKRGRPPKRDSTPPQPGAPKRGRPSRDDQLTAQLAQALSGIAMGGVALSMGLGQLGPDGMPTAGSVARDFVIVGEHADQLAAALVKVSATNPRMRKALEAAVQSTAWSELVMVLIAGIALPIAANHGWLPPALVAMLDATPPAAG